MATFTTMALIGGAVLGGTMIQQRNARKAQEAAMKRAEEEARNREANMRQIGQTDAQEATVDLGRRTGASNSAPAGGAPSVKASGTQKGSVKRRVGGLSRRPSSGIGL